MNVVKESRRALKNLDWSQVDATVEALRNADRIFCVGNGGGYAHAMHFASDLRKIAHKQAFSFDNVAEMTARINDESWSLAWLKWMESFPRVDRDVQFIFSVNGALNGAAPSLNLPFANYGIVGANGKGSFRRIVIPSTSTPVIEGCQSVVAHHLVEALRP